MTWLLMFSAQVGAHWRRGRLGLLGKGSEEKRVSEVAVEWSALCTGFTVIWMRD